MKSKEALQYIITCFKLGNMTTEDDLEDVKLDKEQNKVVNAIANDLEVLEIIKSNPELVWWVCCYKNAYELIADRKGFMLDYDMKTIEWQFNKVKEWLEK